MGAENQDQEVANNTEAASDETQPLLLKLSLRNHAGEKVSSLDFERIVNQYSIQAVRDEWMMPSLPIDGSIPAADDKVSRLRKIRSHKQQKKSTTHNNDDDEDLEAGNNDGKRRQQRKSSVIAKEARRKQSRGLLGYTGKKATRWFLSMLAGLLTGLTTILIVKMSEMAVSLRSQHLQDLIINPAVSDLMSFTIFSALNCAEALLACWLCVAWVPQATGSGISRVKGYLNGIRCDNNFVASWPIFFVKVVGTILSVSSGLAVGQEGPLIFIGAIMGSACSRISGITSKYLNNLQNPSTCCSFGTTSFPPCGCIGNSNNHYRRHSRYNPCNWTRRMLQKALLWTTTELTQFATHAERRDLVSIGASCGFAASFGAPVGGLLFILDDISSYFSKALILRILVANVIGTFCLALQRGDLSNYSVINLGKSETIIVNRVEEVPLYIFLGVMGGILGGLFCTTTMLLRKNITKRLPKGKAARKWNLIESDQSNFD